MNTEIRILLEDAAEYLEGLNSVNGNYSLGGFVNVTTTNQPALFRIAPLLARELRETLEEYSDPGTTVLCEHCWANVKMAEALVSGSPRGLIYNGESIIPKDKFEGGNNNG